MIDLRRVKWFAAFLGTLCVCAGSSYARDIGGEIDTTLTITEDSQLVDDVTCKVNGDPCIRVGAPGVTLELNGFTMTGQADARTACNGGPSTFDAKHDEDGIDLQEKTDDGVSIRDVTIRGPGLIKQFRGAGIFSNFSGGLTVTGVTVSTNCRSGILIGGGAGHDLSHNVSVRNGSGTFACGGI